MIKRHNLGRRGKITEERRKKKKIMIQDDEEEDTGDE